jgi:hypothetical protein
MATTLYKARLNDAKQQLMNSDISQDAEAQIDIFEPMEDELEI